MLDSIVDAAHDAMGTPWIYLALFAFSMIDAFLPAVPSESLVISAGVFAADGKPTYWLVVLMAALGAFVGDHISYAVGRFGGSRVYERAQHGSRRHRAFTWADRTLKERGGVVLIIARYIPGGRTAVTLTMGSVRYPLRTFTFFDSIAAISWAFYSATIGYIGGASFEESPTKGLIVGFGVAFGIAMLVELVRHVRSRRVNAREQGLP